MWTGAVFCWDGCEYPYSFIEADFRFMSVVSDAIECSIAMDELGRYSFCHIACDRGWRD
jgi:hypothetical protein